MGWLARLLGSTPREEMLGLTLDDDQWELDGPRTFEELLDALRGWLPEGSVLYLEGGEPDDEILEFLDAHSVPEQAKIARGTIWPRPRVFHVLYDDAALQELAGIMDHHANMELAVHFHVYRDNVVLLQSHDVFDLPILLSGRFSEQQVASLASRLGTEYRRIGE